MTKKNPLRGEERKIVSTRIYRSEFANFVKICKAEGNKSVNNKMREMIREEIEKDSTSESKTLLTKQKEDLEHSEEILRLQQNKYHLEVKGVGKNV